MLNYTALLLGHSLGGSTITDNTADGGKRMVGEKRIECRNCDISVLTFRHCGRPDDSHDVVGGIVTNDGSLTNLADATDGFMTNLSLLAGCLIDII